MIKDNPLMSRRRQMYAISIVFLCYLMTFHYLIPVFLKLTKHTNLINTEAVLIISAIFMAACSWLLFVIFHLNITLSDGKTQKKSATWIISLFAVSLILDIGATGFNTLLNTPLTSFMHWLSELMSTTDLALAPKLSHGEVDSAMYFVFFAPVLEELVFRGLFYGALRRYGRWLAIIASALMFGFMHINIYQFVGATLSGIIYAVLRDKAGLRMSIALHILTNWTNTVLVPLLLEHTTYSALYYRVLLANMILSIVIVGLCFSRKNPNRESNIAYLELDICKTNQWIVWGNPVLLACFVLCVVLMIC